MHSVTFIHHSLIRLCGLGDGWGGVGWGGVGWGGVGLQFTAAGHVLIEILHTWYSKACLKWPIKNRQNKGLKDKW